ncbi:MAG: hypothetical protein J6V07_04210 [Clostridia bacterium]|nr:hypothetical protein [Clostridia bacterium]
MEEFVSAYAGKMTPPPPGRQRLLYKLILSQNSVRVNRKSVETPDCAAENRRFFGKKFGAPFVQIAQQAPSLPPLFVRFVRVFL